VNKTNLELTRSLQKTLHACPELSGCEQITLRTIRNFLERHTSLEVVPMDGWLLARHIEGNDLPIIAFRGDIDAIPTPDGPEHGCGHDGHSAILCGLGLELEGVKTGKNIYLIFQPAEETGEGAEMIVRRWDGFRNVQRIYGLHNIPGYRKGVLLTRDTCFACASSGMIVHIKGHPAHAAYPADGANPTEMLSRLTLSIPGMIDDILSGDERLLMHTVVGLNIGGENFGVSPGEGRLCLTLRGHRQADIDALAGRIREFVQRACAEQNMEFAFEMRDVFPDTTCDPKTVAHARSVWTAAGMPVITLAEPMRWSEDFGRYLKNVPGMFFGIGSGEDAPGLHTRDYEFDDTLIEPAVDAFTALVLG